MALPPRLTVLAGRNAQGKTNFLRALELLGLGEAGVEDAVRHGAERALVEGTVERDGRAERLAVALAADGGARLLAGGKAVPRPRWVGRLPVLYVGPEDREQVAGPPAARRALLDELLEQSEPAYLAALREYRRALKQRNRVLADGAAPPEAAEIWEEPLARTGGELLARRFAAAEALGPRAQAWHRELATEEGAKTLGVAYRSTVAGPSRSRAPDTSGLADSSRGRPGDPWGAPPSVGDGGPAPAAWAAALRRALEEGRARDRAVGTTLAGPHRDDLGLELDGRAVRSQGSAGEMWTAILALALASAEYLGARLGRLPLLLLDDVLASLDERRRARLLGVLKDLPQAVLTATWRPPEERGVTVLGVEGHRLADAAGEEPVAPREGAWPLPAHEASA